MRTTSFKSLALLIGFHLLVVIAAGAEGVGQGPRVTNTAKYVGSGRYDWTVYLVADDATLDTIRYVEYTLHPSFPDPVRRVENRKNKFAFSSNGWVEFNILIKVVYKDGRVSHLEHRLRLTEAPKAQTSLQQVPAHQHGTITTTNTSEYKGDDRWDWSVFIVSDEKTLNEINCVEYTLHPTFPNPVRRVCDKGSTQGRGFYLNASGWGTFNIGIKVIFKDGDIRYLNHELSFGGKR